jgi:hypothetical protein
VETVIGCAPVTIEPRELSLQIAIIAFRGVRIAASVVFARIARINRCLRLTLIVCTNRIAIDDVTTNCVNSVSRPCSMNFSFGLGTNRSKGKFDLCGGKAAAFILR